MAANMESTWTIYRSAILMSDTAVPLKWCSPAQRLSVAKIGWPRFGDEGCLRHPTLRCATVRTQPQARHAGRAEPTSCGPYHRSRLVGAPRSRANNKRLDGAVLTPYTPFGIRPAAPMTSRSTPRHGNPHSGTQTTGQTGVSHATIPAPTTQPVKVMPPQPDTW
jgi:hypothetical protein